MWPSFIQLLCILPNHWENNQFASSNVGNECDCHVLDAMSSYVASQERLGWLELEVGFDPIWGYQVIFL